MTESEAGRPPNMADGRIMSIVNNPIEGGRCVATHEDVTEAKRAEERIWKVAHVDALTGRPNRKAIYGHIDDASKSILLGGRLAVLSLDLDHFKRVNDTLGHTVVHLRARSLLFTLLNRLISRSPHNYVGTD